MMELYRCTECGYVCRADTEHATQDIHRHVMKHAYTLGAVWSRLPYGLRPGGNREREQYVEHIELEETRRDNHGDPLSLPHVVKPCIICKGD